MFKQPGVRATGQEIKDRNKDFDTYAKAFLGGFNKPLMNPLHLVGKVLVKDPKTELKVTLQTAIQSKNKLITDLYAALLASI